MFELNSDLDDSENDEDYVPSCDELKLAETEGLIEVTPTKSVSLAEITNSTTDKIKNDQVYEQFLSEVKSNSNKKIKSDNVCAEDSTTTKSSSPDTGNCHTESNYKNNHFQNSETFESGQQNNNPTERTTNRKRSSLDFLIKKVNKKPKLTTLQKSLEDWNSFKRDEGLEESIKYYNKGKEGYLERQSFLHRSDNASFEIERSLRLAKK